MITKKYKGSLFNDFVKVTEFIQAQKVKQPYYPYQMLLIFKTLVTY